MNDTIKMNAIITLKYRIETSIQASLSDLSILDLKELSDQLYSEHRDIIGARLIMLINLMKDINMSKLTIKQEAYH